MIVGRDQGIGGGAFSWDVEIHNFVFVVLHFLIYFKDKSELIIITC